MHQKKPKNATQMYLVFEENVCFKMVKWYKPYSATEPY